MEQSDKDLINVFSKQIKDKNVFFLLQIGLKFYSNRSKIERKKNKEQSFSF